MQVLSIIAATVFSFSLSMGQNSEPYFFENDYEGAGWINCGEGPSWHLDSEQFHNGTGSLKSGDLECNGISKVCRYIQGPASIEFWWKSIPIPNSESQLSFYVDGKRERSWNSEWRREPPIYMGENRSYTVTWELNKKSCPPGTKGYAWIDDVLIKYDNNISVSLPANPEPFNNRESQPSAINNTVVSASDNTIAYVSTSPNPKMHIYGSINEAIKHVVPGGTIIIDQGEYSEDVLISAPLTLIGKSQERTIILSEKTAITAESDNIIIKNLAVKGINRNSVSQGIWISGDYCSIINSSVSNFYDGIVADGCHDLSVRGCNVSNLEQVGVYLINTSQISNIQFNNISYSKHGICLHNSTGIRVSSNCIYNSDNGISLRVNSSDNEIDLGNKFYSIDICDISDESGLKNVIPNNCDNTRCLRCDVTK